MSNGLRPWLGKPIYFLQDAVLHCSGFNFQESRTHFNEHQKFPRHQDDHDDCTTKRNHHSNGIHRDKYPDHRGYNDREQHLNFDRSSISWLHTFAIAAFRSGLQRVQEGAKNCRSGSSGCCSRHHKSIFDLLFAWVLRR